MGTIEIYNISFNTIGYSLYKPHTYGTLTRHDQVRFNPIFIVEKATPGPVQLAACQPAERV